MALTQLIKPNLDPYIYQIDNKGKQYILMDWLGWCQAYLEQAFGFKWLYASALDSWNKSSSQHKDTSFPVGVYFPVYYKGYKVNGVDVGHTMIVKMNSDGSGTFWSSPKTRKPYADKVTFKNVAEMHSKLKSGWASSLVYLGWSEHVGTKRVITNTYTKEVTEAKPIAFTKKTVEDNTLPEGTTTITQKGINGTRTIVYTVTIKDGKEVSRKVKSDKTTKEPVEEITSVGTYIEPPVVVPPVEPPVTPPVDPPVLSNPLVVVLEWLVNLIKSIFKKGN